MNLKERVTAIVLSVYYENTVIVTTIATIIAFVMSTLQISYADTLLKSILPLFLAVFCIEILFIRKQLLSDINEIKLTTSGSTVQLNFRSGEEFDKYLEYRTLSAEKINVIHFSSFTSSSESEKVGGYREGRRYTKIIEKFINSGGKFHRIFCNTDEKQVFSWIQDEIERFQGNIYINYVKDLKINNLRLIGIMIIDDNEVCLGGGYNTTFTEPTIAIKSTDLASFFQDYYNHLLSHSAPISTGDRVDASIFKKKLNQ